MGLISFGYADNNESVGLIKEDLIENSSELIQRKNEQENIKAICSICRRLEKMSGFSKGRHKEHMTSLV